jgi:hypothetical protein
VRNNLLIIFLTLLGWIIMKYLLLGNVSFENSFKYGFLYHGTALVTLAVLATANGIRSMENTPGFLVGFKHIAKSVIIYALGATLSVGVWHHVIVQKATHARLETLKVSISTHFESEADFQEETNKNNLGNDVTLSDWVASQHEAAEIFYSPKAQISLTLMVYLVVGIFISFIASLLWTKVWGMQQISSNPR